MAKQLTIPLVSVLLLGSGAALGQVSSPDIEQLQGQLWKLHQQVSTLQTQVTQIAATSTHTVKNGETLWGISRKYRVDFTELAKLNGLSSSKPVIRIGQRLKLPNSADKRSSRQATSYRTHIVAPNETLYKIAKRHSVSMQSLSEANSLSNPNDLKIGQTIRIPIYGTNAPKQKAAAPLPLAKSKRPAKQEYGPYTVQSGDTIQSIAKTYGVTPTALLRLNSRASTPKYQPRTGERLMVPTDGTWYVPGSNQTALRQPQRSRSSAAAPATAHIKHTVAPNETLGELAQRFGTTVQQIKLDNPSIKSQNDLRVGTDLRIRRR